jgi:hypothetical protein
VLSVPPNGEGLKCPSVPVLVCDVEVSVAVLDGWLPSGVRAQGVENGVEKGLGLYLKRSAKSRVGL